MRGNSIFIISGIIFILDDYAIVSCYLVSFNSTKQFSPRKTNCSLHPCLSKQEGIKPERKFKPFKSVLLPSKDST